MYWLQIQRNETNEMEELRGYENNGVRVIYFG